MRRVGRTFRSRHEMHVFGCFFPCPPSRTSGSCRITMAKLRLTCTSFCTTPRSAHLAELVRFLDWA